MHDMGESFPLTNIFQDGLNHQPVMIIITRVKYEDLNTKLWGFMGMSPTNYGYSLLNRTVNLNLCMDVINFEWMNMNMINFAGPFLPHFQAMQPDTHILIGDQRSVQNRMQMIGGFGISHSVEPTGSYGSSSVNRHSGIGRIRIHSFHWFLT